MKLKDLLAKLPADKIEHLKWGSAGAIGMVGLLVLALRVHPSVALAVGGVMLGWGVERYQAVRKEGVPSNADAVATAIPCWVAAAIWWLAA